MGTEAELNKDDGGQDGDKELPAKYRALTEQASFREKWAAKGLYETVLCGRPNLELGNGKNDSSGGDDESIVQQYSRKSKEQMYTDLFNGYMNLTNV